MMNDSSLAGQPLHEVLNTRRGWKEGRGRKRERNRAGEGEGDKPASLLVSRAGPVLPLLHSFKLPPYLSQPFLFAS